MIFFLKEREDAPNAADPRETPDINSPLPCHVTLVKGSYSCKSQKLLLFVLFYHICKNTLSFHEIQDLLQSFHLKIFAFSSLKLWFFLYLIYLFIYILEFTNLFCILQTSDLKVSLNLVFWKGS